MTDKDDPHSLDKKRTLAKVWGKQLPMDYGDRLFKANELDIYGNKVTCEIFFFHGKIIDYDAIESLEYNPDDYTVTVVRKDGQRMDLGVKIQWLVRPYIGQAHEVSIVRTQNGNSVDGVVVPLVHIGEGG